MVPLRILFVTPYVPSRLRVRPYGFIRSLAQRGHRLTLLAAARSAKEYAAVADLENFCEQIKVVRIPLASSLWSCAHALVRDVPLQALFTYSLSLEAALAELLAPPQPFDIIHVEHLRASLLGLEARGAPRVFDSVDCITSLFERAARYAPTRFDRWRARIDVQRTRRFEGELTRRFEAVVVSSEADRQALEQVANGLTGPSDAGCAERAQIRVVSNGVDLDYFAPAEEPRADAEIVFVGRMSYHANVAASVRLVEEVMPLVWRQRPNARVTIVGSDPSRRVRDLGKKDSRVRVTGFVSDVRPYLTRAAIAAVPLVYGGGVQNKILEAMACGTPVVAAPDACTAIRASHGEHLLQAGGVAEFASEVLRLMGDADLRRRIGLGGRRFVAAEHSWNSVVSRLDELYQEVIARHRCGGRAEDRRVE